MNTDMLREETRAFLSELLMTLAQTLHNQPSPHLRLVSYSSIESEDVLIGGTIRTATPPPLQYDKNKLRNLHKSTLLSAAGTLYGLVVIGTRLDANSSWILDTKLISKEEHDSVLALRKPIDTAVERKLRSMVSDVGWERASFGPDNVGAVPDVVVKSTDGELKRSTPDGELLTLLERAKDVYRQAGLELLIARWRLAQGGLEFKEYYE